MVQNDLTGNSPAVYTTYARDALGRITLVAHRVLQTDSAHTITHYYNRDALGRVSYQGDGDTTGTASQTLTSSAYTYSHTGEVSAVIHTGPQAAANYTEAYTTDLNGNRTTNGGTAQTDGANNQIASDGKFAYEYDFEGNRVSRTNLQTGEFTVYTWDQRDRLTRVAIFTNNTKATLAMQVDYRYDCFDRLIGRTQTGPTGGATASMSEFYIFDGKQIVATLDATGAIKTRFLWGPETDQLLAEEYVQAATLANGQTATGLLWTLSDQLGTIRDRVNTSGEITQHCDYDSFGVLKTVTTTTSASPSSGLTFGYTGKPLDVVTRLQWNLRRWYDSPTGTWISRDPGGFDMGDPNLGRYTGGDPVNFTDPRGYVTDDPYDPEAERGDLERMQDGDPTPARPPQTGERAAPTTPKPRVVPIAKEEVKATIDPERISDSQVNAAIAANGLVEDSYFRVRSVWGGLGNFIPYKAIPVPLEGGKTRYLIVTKCDLNSKTWRIARISKDGESAERAIQIAGEEAKNNATAAVQGKLDFLLGMIPFVQTIQHLAKGEIAEGLISGAGDIGSLLTGGAGRLIKSATWGPLAAKTGIILQASVVSVRTGQGFKALAEGDLASGAGKLGEALLRLFALKVSIDAGKSQEFQAACEKAGFCFVAGTEVLVVMDDDENSGNEEIVSDTFDKSSSNMASFIVLASVTGCVVLQRLSRRKDEETEAVKAFHATHRGSHHTENELNEDSKMNPHSDKPLNKMSADVYNESESPAFGNGTKDTPETAMFHRPLTIIKPIQDSRPYVTRVFENDEEPKWRGPTRWVSGIVCCLALAWLSYSAIFGVKQNALTTKNIEDVTIGDKVLAKDAKTGTVAKITLHSRPSIPSAATFPREKIENLRVGQRVVASLSNATDSYPTSVDQKTWRLLKLQGEWRWADGTQDVIQVESLQPPDWIRDHGAEVGALVPFPLDLLEMGVPEGLLARVVANESCPEIKPGKGRVILNTVNHLNNDVYELTVNNGKCTEVLRPTGLHKFYSETRQDWVSTKDLQPEESLSGINEPLTVVYVHSLPGTQRVYNIKVEDEHVYRVSSLAALTHNNGCSKNLPKDFPTGNTKNWSAAFKSEGEARNFARAKLGRDPIEYEQFKWRSQDGKWQYRAKPDDLNDLHIHLEELNPTTGEVLQNLHLRFPEAGKR